MPGKKKETEATSTASPVPPAPQATPPAMPPPASTPSPAPAAVRKETSYSNSDLLIDTEPSTPVKKKK
ncbi:MAG: hypothetical protein HQL65_03480 [Magnetococcales bacterium]|nr:hypothetical protein [Magnetococcales bacterium]